MSIFSTLNTGVSGMHASQVQIGIAGHNITNAHNEHYTRQRAVQTTAPSFNTPNGDIGMGTKIQTIVRIHDELVWSKLRAQGSKVSANEYLKTKLEEASQRFPDLADSGLLKNFQDYHTAWNDYASNPADGAMKINLIQHAKTLADAIQSTRKDLENMQLAVNRDIELSIEEINHLGSEIAKLNREINMVESKSNEYANDLRDKRDEFEMQICRQVGAKVFKERLEQSGFETTPDRRDGGLEYHLNIEGFSIVDGETFHPLKLSSVDAGSFMQNIYYELQDGTRANIATQISGGKIGAALDLRGRHFNEDKGGFGDGILQDYIDTLDTLASELIMNTNRIYASAAQQSITSKPMRELQPDNVLMSIDNRINAGSFDLIVYDSLGNEVVRKSIEIDPSTSIAGSYNTNSLIERINSDTDDNDNHNPFDDFDDYFKAGYSWDEGAQMGTVTIFPKQVGYRIGIEDNGTNVAGVLALGEFFSGNNARDIEVSTSLQHDPTSLRASKSGADGNNDVANAINQLQYEVLSFHHPDGSEVHESIGGYYRAMVTKIASIAQNNNTVLSTNKAVYENIQAEYQSISGVNVNEELADLMKFQAAFGASAKIISTIDKMVDTLLGIKQ